MSTAQVIHIGQDLLLTAVLLSLPAILVSLVVGIAISVFQAVTSLQEQTMTFAPRIIAVAITLIIALPWSIRVATSFTGRMMQHFLGAAQ
jgi:flagellar biosynthetic protein FliQ